VSAIAQVAPAGVSVGEHLAALLDGEFARGLAGFSEQVVWHVPGHGQLAGVHRGREAVLAVLGELLAPTDGRLRIGYRLLSANDPYLVEWLEIGAAGRATGCPVVSRSEAGRIREVWWCGSAGV